ncbi:hypothetical protein GCM10011403_26870 [Pseudohongiella nitratireducens]|jgi:type I restriction enzyme S subunit|uniref:Type I restriction modification DNA specificity domain-containing protein n=1 Tax=Pseudohongiella nitratireducens TaxID=1768907 RepID=A0A916QMZ2_9GAMM|nr:restriction endonuclease subunit S [Pseudohongiella nitratireducens]GFZ82013.1 hypothetical protein GCM10011403_26870 [Pseudohongiella nitratireducens]|tara:strand:- start:4104 stop:5378 length:1275 start_codon:yes stop_codon:yes gene_type:complete
MSNSIPKGWKESSIGQITASKSLFSDGDWVESKDQDPFGSNRLIQLADIGDGTFINKSARFMNDEQFSRLRCTALQEHDILIARMPEPLGRACLYPGKDRRAATVVDIAIIRTTNADHYWLMSAINSSQFRYQIDLNASGTTRTRIARGALSKIKVLEPPLPEQKKIATILSSVDEVIEKTRAQIEKLKDLKTGMMQELLTKGIGHTEFKDSPVGRIPSEWCSACLGSLLSKKPKYGANAPAVAYEPTSPRYIRITDILDNGELDTTSAVGIDPQAAEGYYLSKGDLLIARTGNTVGKSYLHQGEILTVFAGYLIKFVISPTVALPDYVYWYTKSHQFDNWIKNTSRIGAQPNINATEYSEMLLPLPPLSEQKAIVSTLDKIHNTIIQTDTKLHHLKHLKVGLMQDLLTGKVRVNVNQEEAATA